MATHLNLGDEKCSVAFIFSAPGKAEETSGHPATGATGENMTDILEELNYLNSDIFPSTNRYYYRITNSSSKVFYARKDNGKTEDNPKNIKRLDNINRILDEIDGCRIIILCGARAHEIKDSIKDKIVVLTYHFGNRWMGNKYPNSEFSIRLSSEERNKERMIRCAKEIYDSINIQSTII